MRRSSASRERRKQATAIDDGTWPVIVDGGVPPTAGLLCFLTLGRLRLIRLWSFARGHEKREHGF
jgi:hypothetical protein